MSSLNGVSEFILKIKSGLHEELAPHLLFLDLPLHERKSLITKKSDHSPVTEIDLLISTKIKNLKSASKVLASHHFFSEEDQESFGFPSIILDPIDGTRELVTGVNECAISLAILENEKFAGFSWIYNPFNHFEISSGREKKMITPNDYAGRPLLGFLSRSEWKDGFGKNHSNDIVFKPVGSIAYKLALCAGGAADFVFSFRPKNIWDIAAGTMLLRERGFVLYERGIPVELVENRRYMPPLLWTLPENYDRIIGAIGEV